MDIITKNITVSIDDKRINKDNIKLIGSIIKLIDTKLENKYIDAAYNDYMTTILHSNKLISNESIVLQISTFMKLVSNMIAKAIDTNTIDILNIKLIKLSNEVATKKQWTTNDMSELQNTNKKSMGQLQIKAGEKVYCISGYTFNPCYGTYIGEIADKLMVTHTDEELKGSNDPSVIWVYDPNEIKLNE